MPQQKHCGRLGRQARTGRSGSSGRTPTWQEDREYWKDREDRDILFSLPRPRVSRDSIAAVQVVLQHDWLAGKGGRHYMMG